MTNETVDKQEIQENSVDYEAKAREIGWTPKDKFKGDPEKWVDAKSFYEKGEHVVPILRQQRDEARKANDATKSELLAVKAEVEEIKKDASEAIKFMQAGLEREYQAKVAALRAEKADAISAGDGAKVIAIDEKIDELKVEKKEAKAEVKEKVAQETPQIHPDFPKWVEKNQWYATNEEMKEEADMLGARYAKKGLRDQALWDAVTNEVMKRYPEEFPETEKNRGGPERGGKTTGKTNGSAKSYENLPDDAKKACDKYVKNGWAKNREAYCELYYSQEQ